MRVLIPYVVLVIWSAGISWMTSDKLRERHNTVIHIFCNEVLFFEVGLWSITRPGYDGDRALWMMMMVACGDSLGGGTGHVHWWCSCEWWVCDGDLWGLVQRLHLYDGIVAIHDDDSGLGGRVLSWCSLAWVVCVGYVGIPLGAGWWPSEGSNGQQLNLVFVEQGSWGWIGQDYL